MSSFALSALTARRGGGRRNDMPGPDNKFKFSPSRHVAPSESGSVSNWCTTRATFVFSQYQVTVFAKGSESDSESLRNLNDGRPPGPAAVRSGNRHGDSWRRRVAANLSIIV
jgi:hypothetical protein